MIYNLVAQGGIQPSGTKTINITSNGTTTEDVAAYANAQVIANVPNTYTAGDEGKVVSSGALVSQGSSTYTANGIYNTTTIGTVEVSINTAPTLQSKAVAFTPAENVLTSSVTADVGYDGLNEVDITVNAIPSTYVGTGIPQRTSLNVAGSTVTASSGYYASSVSANVAAGTAATPATTITANPTIAINASGLITATAASTSNITPAVTAGYITGGTAGTVTVTGTKTSQLATQSGVTVTPTTASQTAVASGRWTTGSVIVAPIPSAYLIPTGTSNITANANGINIASYASVNVNVPNSYSAADEGKVVNGGGLIAQGSSTYTANGIYNTVSIGTIEVSINTAPTLQSKAETYTPAETVITDTITADPGYDGLNRVDVRVNAISSTYVGTGIARKSSADLTASGSVITAPAGYYSSGASKAIAGGTAFTPATTITVNPGITVNAAGLITATNTGSSNITPTVTAGYVSSGTAGTVSVTGTKTSQLTTQAASTITPTTASQLAVASGRWTTGSVYVAPIPGSYIIPTGTSTINITSNGTTTHNVSAFASAQVITNVPNTYSAGDQGLVVSGASLISQSSALFTSNSTYDTTFISEVTVSVAGGGGGGVIISDTIDPVCGGVIREITAEAFTKATLSVTSNGVYNAPVGVLYDTVDVDVAGGGGGYTIDDIAMRTVSGNISGSASFIANYAFTRDLDITGASFSQCTSIEAYAFGSCSNLTYASFPLCTTIESNAFYSCAMLSAVSLPECTYISAFAFFKTALVSIDLPKLQSTGTYLFSGCASLVEVSAPLLEALGAYAFLQCSNLSMISLPKVSTISNGTFVSCYNLRSAYFSVCDFISTSAFAYCSALSDISFPMCSRIFTSAFSYCTGLVSVSFPRVSEIGSSAFNNCTGLETASFGLINSISTYAFQNCRNLNTVILSSTTVSNPIISTYTFASCFNLLSLYLLASRVYSLGATNAFLSTPISTYTTSTGGVNGSIFVKASLYNSYITATNWATYSARIVSLTDAQVQNVIDYGRHDP